MIMKKKDLEKLWDTLAAFMTNKGHAKLGRNIKGMIKLEEDWFELFYMYVWTK